MAKRTIADLEQELDGLRKENEELQGASKELVEVKKELVSTKAHSKESEARLMASIDNMERPVIIDGQVQGSSIKVFTGSGYTEDLIERGVPIVSKFTIEVLRVFINSNYPPSTVMKMFGLTQRQLQSYVWKLSAAELRGDKPIKLSFTQDAFGKEG